MWTLIGTGVLAAFGYSVVATVAPDLFPASFREHGHVAVYFEAAATIVSLTLLGQLLELRARSKTSAAIKALLGLAPKTARRVREDGSEEISAVAGIVACPRVLPGENCRSRRRLEAIPRGQSMRPANRCRWPSMRPIALRRDPHALAPCGARRRVRFSDWLAQIVADCRAAQRTRAHASLADKEHPVRAGRARVALVTSWRGACLVHKRP